jgi:hypothetical protein
MLKTRALEKYLSQASGPGVTDIMLFNKEGSSSIIGLNGVLGTFDGQTCLNSF